MYSVAAASLKYKLPKMVTLTVFESDPTDFLSRSESRRRPRTGSLRPDRPWLGVYGLLQHRQLGEHLFDPPRQRPALVQERVPLLFQRLDAGLHVFRQMGVLAQGGLERPHLRSKLIAFTLEAALLVPKLRHQIGDGPDAFLECRQFLQDAAHARRASPATPRTSA